MKTKRSENGAPTRKDEIIRVASIIFAAKGYHGTTLEEIARKMGISKPALYYHIKNKAEILREVIGRMMEPMEEVATVGRSDLPPTQRIEQIITLLVKFAVERTETTLIAFEQNKMLPRKSQDALRRRQKEVELVLQETLEEGKKNGTFSFDNAKITSFTILATANWVYHWYKPGAGLTYKQIANQIINLIENGLLKK
jgi:TetR/AcrR family transcriptional regulator, cholesterol catabolism regulator